ncbi:hypothetical protein N8014_04915 [Pseudomonadota bacterium]|nr:hypothetical protein [Pseudomonadota bacterium]
MAIIFGYLTIILGVLASIATLVFIFANPGTKDGRTSTGWKDNLKPDNVFGLFLLLIILWVCTFYLSKISTLPSWFEPVIYYLNIIGEVIAAVIVNLPVLWDGIMSSFGL